MATPRSLGLADKLWGWRPHSAGQRAWMLSRAKVKAAACGRRWGKSESSGVDTVLFALENPNTTQFVLAPTADQTRIIMGEVQRRLYAIPGFARCFTEKRSPYWEFTFHDGNGLLEPTRIVSRTVGQTGRGLRGWKAHKVRVDEAAFVADRIYDAVITPLLADYDGDLELMSTPDGVGSFFHRGFMRGRDTTDLRAESFQFPTRSNPYIPVAYLDSEQITKPELVFAQEYEAQFLDQEGAVFRKVMACATATAQAGRVQGKNGRWHEYIMGIDWARTRDFTVLTILDLTTRELVALDRFNQVDFALQRKRVRVLYEAFLPTTIIAEANSIGQPNIEALQADGLPVQPFTTTNATKAEIVDTLALAFERQNIGILPDAQLTTELMAYQGRKLPSGLMQYGAPEGQHDDCVMSLMLCAWGADNAGVDTAPSIW